MIKKLNYISYTQNLLYIFFSYIKIYAKIPVVKIWIWLAFLIFQKKTQEPIVLSTAPIYKSPVIYRSDDYFQRE